MNLTPLKEKISSSKLLTSEERSYWLTNISHMDRVQLNKLDFILSQADSLPWNKQMESYVQKHRTLT